MCSRNTVLWQDATVRPPTLIEEARTFMVQYRRRVVRDAVTSTAMAAMFVFIALGIQLAWVRIGGILAALGALVGVWWVLRGRPSPSPTGAQTELAYRRMLDEAISTARMAPMWTVLPLLPGTTCIGIGLVLAVMKVPAMAWIPWALASVILVGLVVCWRGLWRARTDHTAELLARRESLIDEMESAKGRSS